MIDRRLAGAVLLFVVLASFASPAVSQSALGDASVENVTYSGDSSAETADEGLLLWHEGPHEFDVEITTDSGGGDAAVCLSTPTENGVDHSELACQSTAIESGNSTSVTVAFDEWPAERNGSQSLRVTVESPGNDAVIAERVLDLTVLARDGDVDDDGLTNAEEVAAGTDLRVNDTDGDGLEDGMEVGTYGTNATDNDTDGDGLADAVEIEEHQTDPTTADTDGDGLEDGVELGIGTDPNVADTDGDGLPDRAERERYETDPTAADTDGDGLDDGSEVREHKTDPLKRDTDGDGLPDNLEVFTYETDPIDSDTDGDGLEDGTEVNEYRTDPTLEDSDGDGLSDGSEINVYETNPRKADTDGDGLDDGAEVNRYDTDPLDPDTDDDGVGDAEEVDRSTVASPVFTRGLAVGVVLAVLAGAFAVARADGSPVERARRALSTPSGNEETLDEDRSGNAADSADDGDGESADADEPTAEEEADARTTDDAADAGTTGDAADSEPTENASHGFEDVDLDLMPNGEVVLTVLEANDGKIRQSTLVEETGWSKAKVSRVLSRMEADEEIVKVSIGRGNLITTPDDVPPGVSSPFDE